MGYETFSRTSYKATVREIIPKSGPATARAEQKARETGKLNPLVDPAEYGVIRRSLPRFEQSDDGLYMLTVGVPMPLESRVDTTGSMGHNVDVAIKVLPNVYDLCAQMLPDYDLQIATGIFGDIVDNFVLCRPQFEMTAEKIVEQLSLMVPERDGGDTPEDPHYGLFGAAYLTDARINGYGIKGYDFTISDAPARERLSEKQLVRIFGKEVFDKIAENGHQIDKNDLPTTKEVVKDLLKRAHAFFLQVGDYTETSHFWTEVFGKDRLVILPDTELIPHVQAVIIGLTEGTLGLDGVIDFLTKNNVNEVTAKRILRSVSNIPIGAQVVLRSKLEKPLPKKGDFFASKTDLWPVDDASKPNDANQDNKDSGWL